jgi:hypothetical protein
MRRVLIAGAVLLTVAASPGLAGYIILRVVLDGAGAPAGGGDSGGTGTIGPMGPMGGRPTGPMGPMGPPSSSSGPTGPMGPTGGASGAPASEHDFTRSVVVVIPLETELLEVPLDPKKPFNTDRNPRYVKFTVPLHGTVLRANLFFDSTQIQFYTELLKVPGAKKTRLTQMRDKYALWTKDKKDPQLLYEALLLALESGHIRETVTPPGQTPKDAVTFATELLAVATENKLALSRDAQAFVTAWGAVSKRVLGPATVPGDGPDWQAKLDAKANRTEGHYSLVSWDSSDAEIRRRSRQLNDHFIAFYLLHATRGVALPVPAKPLVAVLPEQSASVPKMRTVLDVLPGTGDAFYAPEHNVLLLAPERSDDVGRTFIRQNQQAFAKGLNRDAVLAGVLPDKLDANGRDGAAKPDDYARAGTLSLIEKLMAEEAEVAAISREGSRQLLFATGGLPAHVTLPEWFANGSVNYFARPRGPLFVKVGDDDKPFMSVAMSTGYGVPNYLLQRALRDLDEHKELNADRAKVLENVLTDAYFSGVKDALDPDPAPPKKKVVPKGPVGPMGPMGPLGPLGPGGRDGEGPLFPGGTQPGGAQSGGTGTEDAAVAARKARERLELKAQATAWSLYYFLARAKPAELKAYLAELNKLPRDLPIDGKTSFAAFVRAFNLSSAPDGPADPARMKKLATEWFDYVTTIPAAYFDVPLVMPEPPKPGTGTGPMGPGLPGPMGPGGDR